MNYRGVMRNVTLTEETKKNQSNEDLLAQHTSEVGRVGRVRGAACVSPAKHSVQLCLAQQERLIHVRARFPDSLPVFVLCVCTCASVRVVAQR